MAGRAPNSEMGSDGEPLRGRCGETEGGWGDGWGGLLETETDGEERGWKAKGRVKVAREAAAPFQRVSPGGDRGGDRRGQTHSGRAYQGCGASRAT